MFLLAKTLLHTLFGTTKDTSMACTVNLSICNVMSSYNMKHRWHLQHISFLGRLAPEMFSKGIPGYVVAIKYRRICPSDNSQSTSSKVVWFFLCQIDCWSMHLLDLFKLHFFTKFIFLKKKTAIHELRVGVIFQCWIQDRTQCCFNSYWKLKKNEKSIVYWRKKCDFLLQLNLKLF